MKLSACFFLATAALTVLAAPPSYQHHPLTFEPNVGQFAPEVEFAVRNQSGMVLLTRTKAILVRGTNLLPLGFRNANPASRPEGQNPSRARTNYLTAAMRHTRIRNYGEVRYRNIYRNIDVVFRGGDEGLEYDFVVGAGGNPAHIRIEAGNGGRLQILPDESLLMEAAGLQIRQHPPHARQVINGVWTTVKCRFRIEQGNRYGFALGSYDRHRELVIDPAITYSTLLGGSVDFFEAVNGIALDQTGNVYIAGTTSALNLPTTAGAFSTKTKGGTCRSFGLELPCKDVFVVKLDPGGHLVYSTYLGGSDNEVASGIAVDDMGSAYVAGETASADFPTTPGAFRPEYIKGSCIGPDSSLTVAVNCHKGFIAKLSAGGDALVYSTYYGGSGGDTLSGIAVDSARNAWVVGPTSSSDLPVTDNAVQKNWNHPGCQAFGGDPDPRCADALIAKFDQAGSTLSFGTYLGSPGSNYGFGVALDSAGNAYVTGRAGASDGFPVTPGSFQTIAKDEDAFAAKFSNAGALIYSTRIGGSAHDQGRAIAVDNTGAVYVAGLSYSDDFPSRGPLGPLDRLQGFSQDGFVVKLDPAGASLEYSYSLSPPPQTIAVDASGSAVFASNGNGASINVPGVSLADAICNTPFSRAILAKLNPEGSSLTFLGGLRAQSAGAMALDAKGNIWVGGNTGDELFPITAGALQTIFQSEADAFLSKFDLAADMPPGVGCVSHAGTRIGGQVAPGEIITISGTNIGPAMAAEAVVKDGVVQNTLAGVRVLFDGVPSPVLHAESQRIDAIVPFVTAKRTTRMTVEFQGNTVGSMALYMFPVDPGLFTADSSGRGQGAILNQDGTVNSASNPAERGSVITLFATGMGPLRPQVSDGQIAVGPSPLAALPVGVVFDDRASGEVLYAGSAPGQAAGAFQINVRIPDQLSKNTTMHVLFLTVSDSVTHLDFPSQRVLVAVK